MPVNLDALIRYHIIDNCLQNQFRKWSWEDLSNACFLALDKMTSIYLNLTRTIMTNKP